MNYIRMLVVAVSMMSMLGLQAQSESNQTEAHGALVDPCEWEVRFFEPLCDQHKKVVIEALQKSHMLLQELHNNVYKGADAFLKASGDLWAFYNQTMAVLLPSQQEMVKCLMLPCHAAYKASLEKYQKYEALVAALEIVPSIDLMWKKLDEFMPHEEHVTAEMLKQGVTKALRKAAIKKQIETMLQEQIVGVQRLLDHITQRYPELIAQYQREYAELEAKLQAMIEAQEEEQN